MFPGDQMIWWNPCTRIILCLISIQGDWCLEYLKKLKESKNLEIGAGTGGTSANVLKAIADLASWTYIYTDVSSHFLAYGRKSLVSIILYHSLLDVQRSLALKASACTHLILLLQLMSFMPRKQWMLHWEMLCLINGDGIVVINELTWFSTIFSTMTFGLNFWTLNRIKGSPLLSPLGWKDLLRRVGPPEVCHGQKNSQTKFKSSICPSRYKLTI